MKKNIKQQHGLPSTASPWPYLGAALWKVVRFLFFFAMTYIVFNPIIYMLSLGIRASEDIYDMSVVWVPKHFTLDSIKVVFNELNFGDAMFRSAYIAVICTFLTVFIGAFTAYGFSRFNFKGKKLLFGIVILTILIPPQLVLMPNYVLFSSFDFFGLVKAITGQPTNVNLLDNIPMFIALAALGQGIRSGLVIYIFRQYFNGIPLELEQAAQIDGCGYMSTYFRIMLPNAMGPIRITVLFSLVWYWSDFYTVTNYMPSVRTVSKVLSNIKGELQMFFPTLVNNRYFMITIEEAACFVSLVPLLILFACMQKSFARSIETTGLVG